MRKIDKKICLATEYFNWQKELSEPVNYSNRKYYKDVVMALIKCQKAICAYTECSLNSLDWVSDENWINGRHISSKLIDEKLEHEGQLDHFNHKLKDNKSWCWDNFFLVNTDVNNKKGVKIVDNIFKPDTEEYSPEIFIKYNWRTHRFVAKENPLIKIDKVKEMLDTLGLNLSFIIKKRELYFTPIQNRLKKGVSNLKEEEVDLCQFFTAFEMSKEELEALHKEYLENN